MPKPVRRPLHLKKQTAMHKIVLLQIISAFLCLFFGYVLTQFLWERTLTGPLLNRVIALLGISVPLVGLLSNSVVFYRLALKKQTTQLPLFAWLVGTSVLWFFLYFIGYFFASNILFYIFIVAISALLFFKTRALSPRLSIMVAIATLVLGAMNVVQHFEEDYCWEKGEAADPTGVRTVKATKEDAARLTGWDVKEGSEIGAAFRAHMLCHTDFSFDKALKNL